jgi:hypothetical protein
MCCLVSVPPPSHLTSCASTKCNLYLYSSHETVMREPALCKFLTFHISNLVSIFRCLGRLSKKSVQVQGSCVFFITRLFVYGKVLLPHIQPPSYGTTHCRLSAAVYSIYSQLPSIVGGRSSIRIPRTRHALVTGTHLTWGRSSTYRIFYFSFNKRFYLCLHDAKNNCSI